MALSRYPGYPIGGRGITLHLRGPPSRKSRGSSWRSVATLGTQSEDGVSPRTSEGLRPANQGIVMALSRYPGSRRWRSDATRVQGWRSDATLVTQPEDGDFVEKCFKNWRKFLVVQIHGPLPNPGQILDQAGYHDHSRFGSLCLLQGLPLDF